MTTTTSSAEPLRERRGSRLAALLLALALLLCLSACGGSDPVCGRWICVFAETDGLSVPASLLDEEETVLFLSSDGRGTLSRGGREGALRWERREDGLFLLLGESSLALAERDGELWLSAEPGLSLRFAREGRAAEPAENGAWYGWWEVTGSQGDMPDSWRDCCALLEIGPYGPELRLWDEDGSWDKPLAVVQLRREGESLSSESGWFLLEDLPAGAWRMTEKAELLELSGSYRHGDEAFDYRIVLRPWGMTWPSDQRLPYRYSDWYLPLIGSGEAMPGRIG